MRRRVQQACVWEVSVWIAALQIGLGGALWILLSCFGEGTTWGATQQGVAAAFSIAVLHLVFRKCSEMNQVFPAGIAGAYAWYVSFGFGIIYTGANMFVGLVAAGVAAFICALCCGKRSRGKPRWLDYVAALPFFIGPVAYSVRASRITRAEP